MIKTKVVLHVAILRPAKRVPRQLLRMRKISTSPSRALDTIVSPVSRNKFGMSMAVRGSVHSAISMSPAFNPVRALRARSAGKGHLSPRKLSIFSATSFSACAPAIASTFRQKRQYNTDTNDGRGS